jgi:membrane protein insertase Oxa1/YidC/SpoIIIJ
MRAQEILSRHGLIHTRTALLLPLVQAPIFVMMSLGVRSMSQSHSYGLNEGGFGWLLDLTQPDPTLITPLVLGFTHLLNFHVSPHSNYEQRISFSVGLICTNKYSYGSIFQPLPIKIVHFYWCSLYQLIRNIIT